MPAPRPTPVWRDPIVLGGVAAFVGIVALVMRRPGGSGPPVAYTTGDIRAMHAGVTVGDHEVRGNARLVDGDGVKTAADGRARIRLDDGTLIVVDGSTELAIKGDRVTLQHGRLFVQGGTASHVDVVLAGATTTVSSSAAAFDAGATSSKVYCARGELSVSGGGHQAHVASGETATLEAAGPKVEPEKAFDDWTGGLAVPWGGDGTQASAIPALWGGAWGEDPGSALVVRAATVDVDIQGEVAVTHTRTSYFNGSDRDLPAEIRLALPAGAIVSRVARADSGKPEVDAMLRAGATADDASVGRLEWAGGGWLRGQLPHIASGATVDLLIDYVEWLPQRGGRATYRFPMASTGASEGEAPMIGELAAHVTASPTAGVLSSVSAGAAVSGRSVDLQRGDVRPSGDLVVEVSPTVVRAGAARAYVTPADKGEDPFVLVRTEVPDTGDSGIALALVIDTSQSVGAASLETERAIVDAVLEGLGPKDSLVVLAADQTVRAVGPDRPSPVTPDLRGTIRKELASVNPGGASNLSAALERAADVLDAPGPGRPGSGMVVYLGDGRATIGEATARDIRRRLGRRTGGVPRMGAVAVGHGADRWLLAQLVAGSGPVYESVDRADAARAGAAIVADALEPTLRDVDIDLGPTIDRIYPREARTALAGTTVTVTGRLRGQLPTQVGFRFRRGAQLVEESRPLDVVEVPPGADVARRWATARIEEMAARGDGIEPAVALAAQARLLTPWTGWFFGGANASLSFDRRLLGLSPTLDGAFASRVEPAPQASSLLLEPPKDFSGDATLEDAAGAAAQRAIEDAVAQLQACRDARAAVRPDVAGSLAIDLSVDATGHAVDVHVSATGSRDDDPVLDRCARSVVAAISFFATGTRVHVIQPITLPPARTPRKTQCSVASTLPLSVRKGLWRARLMNRHLDYSAAARSCELATWSDRRALLELLMAGMRAPDGLALAGRLEQAGEADAAAFVRDETLRRVSSSTELEFISRAIIGNEPKIDKQLDKAYRAARSDADRLDVVRRFLRLAPHNALGRRRLFALLEALGQRDALVGEIGKARTDPFADAGLLAAGASALRRLGMDDEGRRAFGELIERAPGDPWALAYVGDRLRAETLFDDAIAVYERLDAAMPEDPGVALRLALAHAGAGRLDVATRLLERAAQSGGRSDDGRMGELASITEATLLAGARQTTHSPETDLLLAQRLVRTPLPDVAGLVVVRSQPADDPLEVRIARTAKDKTGELADLDAQSIGLSAIRLERGSGAARIRLTRPVAAGPGQPTHATVTALVLGEDRASAKLVTRDVVVAAGDDGVELQWNGESLL
jgi:tetratricopeptide (TPR) repeat protein